MLKEIFMDFKAYLQSVMSFLKDPLFYEWEQLPSKCICNVTRFITTCLEGKD